MYQAELATMAMRMGWNTDEADGNRLSQIFFFKDKAWDGIEHGLGE